jgi:hypothetical protein
MRVGSIVACPACQTAYSNINNALLIEPLDKRGDFGGDAAGLDGGELGGELANDVIQSALAVAALDNFLTGTNEAQDAFGDQQNIALLGGLLQTAAGPEPGLAAAG